MQHFDIVVVGAGLAGSLAALVLADQGRSVALVAPPSGPSDGRTTALMDQSIALVRNLGLWPALAAIAAPLSTMRIVDGTQRLLRAPVVTFHAAEIGLDAFGYNIPNAPFLALLDAAIAKRPTLTRLSQALATLTFDNASATLTLADGLDVTADLVVGADGRRSSVRQAAGIDARTWAYPQTAVVLNFAHQRPHGDISTEFHTANGPFTQVPLPGNRSSLVWVKEPAAAQAMMALPVEDLSLAVEQRMQSMLGKVTIEAERQSFPLSGLTASRFGLARTVLVGEAAHAFPPIGAQGLNLSLRDVAEIAAMLDGLAVIPPDFGDRYDRRRRSDILSRTAGVDLLNRSLLSGFLPVQLLRAAGLQVLATAPPLRNLMMREGVHPGSALKKLGSVLREKIGRQGA